MCFVELKNKRNLEHIRKINKNKKEKLTNTNKKEYRRKYCRPYMSAELNYCNLKDFKIFAENMKNIKRTRENQKKIIYTYEVICQCYAIIVKGSVGNI